MLTNASMMIAVAVACFQMPADEAFERGVKCSRKSEWKQAIVEYSEAIRLEPKHVMARVFRVCLDHAEGAG